MSAKKNIFDLDLDRLQEVLDYDPETGWLTWRKRTGPMCKFGQRAGCIKKQGYRRISIDGVSYAASHLAWLHFYGVPPDNDVVDFKNLDKDDTRIANLRTASWAEDAQNRPRRVDSKTGLKGARKFDSDRNLKKYRSSIRDGKGNRIHLGQFDTPEEAYEAYCKKATELHGEFARLE